MIIGLDDIIIDLKIAGQEPTFVKIEQLFTNKMSGDFISFAFEECLNKKEL